jgi:hypothetical protein
MKPKVNPNVFWELWEEMMCSYGRIICTKHIIVVGKVDSWGGCVCVSGVLLFGGISIASCQSCCELKTSLKKSSLLKKSNKSKKSDSSVFISKESLQI